VVLAIGMLLTLISPVDAVTTRRSAIELISREFSLRISNPIDGVSLPSIVNIKDAELSTTTIVGTQVLAPKGQIYLTFSGSAGPEQLSFGQANWGHFFSTMTPLAPSAVTFRSDAGRRYTAKEANPVNQANNPNATSDDGLLDATYWFLVPSDTRSGTISSSSQGPPYSTPSASRLTPLSRRLPMLSIGQSLRSPRRAPVTWHL